MLVWNVNWNFPIDKRISEEYKSGNYERQVKYICNGGDIWSDIWSPMNMSWFLRRRIMGRMSPNWTTAEVIELDFNKYERRTVKIFVDGLYGCDTEGVNVEDLLKLLALVHAEGSHEMLAPVLDTFVLADMSPVERIDLGMCLDYEEEKIVSLRSDCFQGFRIAEIVGERAENVSENDFLFRMTKLRLQIGGPTVTNEKVKDRIRQIAEHVAGAIPKRLAVVRFGGKDEEDKATDSVSYLEEGATEWKTADLKMKEKRSYHAVVPIGSDVYIVGGRNGQRDLRSVNRLDLTTLSWTECPPMNKERTRLIGCSFEKVGKNFILAAGGYRLSSSEIFDVAKQKWEDGPNMEGREYACSVNVDQDVWVIGGVNGRRWPKTCEIFSSRTMTWRAGPELNEARYGARAVVAKEKIYVAGGHGRHRTVEFIPKSGGEWTLMKEVMNVERIHFGLALFNGGILAVGGHDSNGAVHSSAEWLEDANPEGKWEVHIPMERAVLSFGDLAIL